MSGKEGRHIKEAPAAPAVPKPKKRTGLKILGIVLAFVLVIALGTAGFVLAKFNKLQRTTEAEPVPQAEIRSTTGNEAMINTDKLEQRDSASAIPEDDIFRDKDVINILLIGTDAKIPGTQDPGRADAVVICSLNRAKGDVRLVGFERSIGMPVPGYEDEILSYIYQYGRGPFMQESVSKVFRADLEGYVHIPCETFAAVIDAVGGIDVELTQSEIYYIKRNVLVKEDLQPGMNHLGGIATYCYCDLRRDSDDWHRQDRVRNAIQALVNKLKKCSVKDLNRMMDEILPLVETNLTNTQLSSLMLSAPKFANAKVSQLMIPKKEDTWFYMTGRGACMLGCDYTECARMIREFLYEN